MLHVLGGKAKEARLRWFRNAQRRGSVNGAGDSLCDT